MTQQEVKESLGLQIGAEGVGACEKLLESAGALERLEAAENMAAVRINSDLPTLVDLLPQQAKVKRQVVRSVERLVGSHRNAWQYFQPRELLRELEELSTSDLSRHLRELATLAAFDYVPPFRGRAIHLCDASRPFERLEIDFETLEARKQAEYERLERVLRFARSGACRQKEILRYFGEADAAACNHCDNCSRRSDGDPTRPIERTAEGIALEAVRIALSGVARARRGCGKQLLAQMLCGSRSKKVERNRLDKLSTFGLLGHLTQAEVVKLVEALLAGRLLAEEEIEPFRPVLQLTPQGTEVMSGRAADVVLALSGSLWQKLSGEDSKTSPPVDSESAPVVPATAASAPQVDRELAGRLRAWREETRRAANVPSYVVMSNAVVDELARWRPQTPDALLAIKGMGPAKVRQYGEQLLEILTGTPDAAAEHPPTAEAQPAAELAARSASIEVSAACEAPEPGGASPGEVRLPAPDAAETGAVQPSPAPASSPASHYWTWRLLAAGFTADECAAIRSLRARSCSTTPCEPPTKAIRSTRPGSWRRS